jgi:hypothetical protein
VELFRLVFRPVLGFRDRDVCAREVARDVRAREVARDVCAREVARDVCAREVARDVCAREVARGFVRDLDFICCLYYVLFFLMLSWVTVAAVLCAEAVDIKNGNVCCVLFILGGTTTMPEWSKGEGLRSSGYQSAWVQSPLVVCTKRITLRLGWHTVVFLCACY